MPNGKILKIWRSVSGSCVKNLRTRPRHNPAPHRLLAETAGVAMSAEPLANRGAFVRALCRSLEHAQSNRRHCKTFGAHARAPKPCASMKSKSFPFKAGSAAQPGTRECRRLGVAIDRGGGVALEDTQTTRRGPSMHCFCMTHRRLRGKTPVRVG